MSTPPTGPLDLTVTLDQAKIDAIWAVKDADFPTLTLAQMQAKLVEFALDGIGVGIQNSIRRRGQVVAENAANDFGSVWYA